VTGLLRRTYRGIVPVVARQRIREALRELPIRIRDFPADVKDRLTGGDDALPPPFLRYRVAIDSSRSEFVRVGERCCADVFAAAERAAATRATHPRWLDFGCGAGRIARFMTRNVESLTGIDVDADAIAWAQHHLKGTFRVNPHRPPTEFANGSFDAIYAVSVFTHLDEQDQFAWLAEMRRLLRPGGLFVGTTQPETLTYNRTDMTTDHHRELQAKGFVFLRGFGLFNEDTAFHTLDYLQREWSKFLEPVTLTRSGLANYLDLSVWRR
jgi:SAM-dependent methyltransferase